CGSFPTNGTAAARRFLHVGFHIGVYDASGSQPVLSEGRMSFTGLAEGAGYAKAVRFDDVQSFDAALDELLEVDGPVLVELMTEPLRKGYVKPPVPTEKLPGALAQDWPTVRDSLAASKG